MSTTGQDFVVIGENIHATRVLLRKSERIAANEEGEEAIVFVDEDGATRHLRIPEEEKLSQPYSGGAHQARPACRADRDGGSRARLLDCPLVPEHARPASGQGRARTSST